MLLPEMLLCVVPGRQRGLVLLARAAVMCGNRNADRPGATARGAAMCGTGNMDRPGATNQGYRCYGNESKCVHTYQPAPGQSLSLSGAHKPSSGWGSSSAGRALGYHA